MPPFTICSVPVPPTVNVIVANATPPFPPDPVPSDDEVPPVSPPLPVFVTEPEVVLGSTAIVEDAPDIPEFEANIFALLFVGCPPSDCPPVLDKNCVVTL